MSSVFATVGSTQFDKLIRILDSDQAIEILGEKGYRNLTLQYGSGQHAPSSRTLNIRSGDEFSIKAFDYMPSLVEEMKNADLVISHAGAGSVMESLRAKKNLVIVVNEDLMDNHQKELADDVSQRNHAIATNCENLLETLQSMVFENKKPLPSAENRVIPFIIFQELQMYNPK